MKKLIFLLIGAMLTNANAEEKTRSQSFGELLGKSIYNSAKGITLGISREAGKDIKEITKTPAINSIVVDGKRKTYQNGKLISIEEIK